MSLVQAKKTLSDKTFEYFKSHHQLEFRDGEIDDLASLIGCLTESGCSISDLDYFVVGYKIPQIGKEFDVLRFGKEYIVNIELKARGDEEKIRKQLARNRYYLSFAGLQTYHYMYLSESSSLFELSESGEVEKVEISKLVTLLKEQNFSQIHNVDDFFHPASYLVSPFNSTERFLGGEYFLTSQQEEVVDILVKQLHASLSGFVSLTGTAGTGKSLLAYHFARKAVEDNKKVLVIHCGILNAGHEKLISNGWDVVSIRTYLNYEISDFDLVVIDEAQRLRIKQFEHIVAEVIASKTMCVLSYDKNQTLASHEDRLNIESRVSELGPISSHSLSEKIRSNKEIADFINMLFNKNKNYEARGGKNIQLKYFSTNSDAASYLNGLDSREWQLLKFTPSRYNVEHHEGYFHIDTPSSHTVIGQEFDNVVVVIDELFSYHESGQLVYHGNSYYHPRKMLFQNITRARKHLLVVIINNEELLERCVTILK